MVREFAHWTRLWRRARAQTWLQGPGWTHASRATIPSAKSFLRLHDAGTLPAEERDHPAREEGKFTHKKKQYPRQTRGGAVENVSRFCPTKIGVVCERVRRDKLLPVVRDHRSLKSSQPVIADLIGAAIVRAHIREPLPARLCRNPIPGTQGGFRIGMLRPKLAQSSERDNVHRPCVYRRRVSRHTRAREQRVRPRLARWAAAVEPCAGRAGCYCLPRPRGPCVTIYSKPAPPSLGHGDTRAASRCPALAWIVSGRPEDSLQCPREQGVTSTPSKHPDRCLLARPLRLRLTVAWLPCACSRHGCRLWRRSSLGGFPNRQVAHAL